MTKSELDGMPMYRVMKAITELRRDKHLATTPRIAPITGRTSNNISHILTYLWDWGYVQRKTIRKRKTKASAVPKVTGCVYHYKLTKKGLNKYQKLINRFGKLGATELIPHQPPECCLTQPEAHLDHPAAQAPKPALAGLDRMRELDRLTGKGQK
jgi:hypothetical protein